MNEKDIFLKAFEGYEVKKPPVRVKINGNFIKTCTGKAGWQTVAHAKAALKHHFSSIFDYQEMDEILGKGLGWEQREKWGSIIEEMIRDGVLEFC